MFELFIALGLILLNGVFALSELAIVSARKSRLQAMADEGRPGALTALHLAEDSGRFLSTVQIGITLVGIMAGAFSGAALGGQLTEILLQWGAPEAVARPLGFGFVIAAITYLSLIIGELVPKQLALRNPEKMASRLAPMMALLSRIASPIVWLLYRSTDFVLRLLGSPPDDSGTITEEDLRSALSEAELAGVIEEEERMMISGVLSLGDRPVRAMMTPRTEVDWIDIDADAETIARILEASPHSRLPVAQGDAKEIIGVVKARDLLSAVLAGGPVSVRPYMQSAPVIPHTMDAMDALAVLREAETPMALVHDEYGDFKGLVTPADALEMIVGAFRSDADEPELSVVRREDGSWLIAGWLLATPLTRRSLEGG